MEMTLPVVDPVRLQNVLSRHLSLYSSKVPYYQATMLDTLRELWNLECRRLLDIGGGTGVIAQAMAELFPVEEVHAIDVVDRFCKTLSIATTSYDGSHLPFDAGRFDVATLNNVLHHVPVEARADLLREVRRVVHGPLFIKDHESSGRLDDLRLTALDAIGNVPFGGMLWARYLKRAEWEALAQAAGYRIGACIRSARYRSGGYARLFPNRLEITMRFDPV